MTTAEKRPRIRPSQADLIDAIRGRVPFEGEVENALDMYLQLYVVEKHGRRPRIATDAELMINLLKTDRFMFDIDRLRAAFDAAVEYHRAELDQQAREDEMHTD